MSYQPAAPRRVSVILFDGFELLDVCGPVEVFSMLPEHFAVELVGPSPGPVSSNQGAQLVAHTGYQQVSAPDIVLVPGGQGTRTLVQDHVFLTWLHDWAQQADLVTSVCTGSAVLAAAGLLEGYRATSNKRAFAWASAQGQHVDWIPSARWVEDRNRWTSSGIAAGMDMAAALMRSLCGDQLTDAATDRMELEIHKDPSWDPFAEIHGAV